MSKWLDKYTELKKEVINRICELVGETEINVIEKYPYQIYIQDDFSGEYINYNVTAVTNWGLRLMNPHEDLDKAETTKSFDDLDANELVSICDYLEDNIEELKKQ